MNKQQLLYDLFSAYYECRKNKRNTINALDFELNYESNLIKLADEISNWTYEVWKSIAFIVNKPVKREVFAWDFRDRIVHHYVINKLNPYFEKYFIYDSYSCRVGKWTLFWIKRIEKFIRSCSENYTKDCYILKLDIRWFFMSIDKDILYKKMEKFLQYNNLSLFQIDEINELQQGDELEKLNHNFLLKLIQKIIYNNSIKNCIIKWNKKDWHGLPKSKSLFFTKDNTWLPIWNLTSQVFANFYLDFLDKFIKQKLKIKYYGRYVDDFILVHSDKQYLKYCKSQIDIYLKEELSLTVHPNKIYLQHYTKWVLFLWSFIKPYRIYLKNNIKWNIYEKVNILNNKIRLNDWKINNILRTDFRQSINSYLWLVKHYKTYKLKKYILLNQVSAYFWNYFYISWWYSKVKKK